MTAGQQPTQMDAQTGRRLAEGSAANLWAYVLGALLLAAALLLRLYKLDAQSLWLDEGRTWAEVTGRGWGGLVLDLFSPNAAYPLYHLLLKAWVRLSGESELMLRLPSALAGALAVPAMFALARRLGGSLVGLAAALLMLVSPFALWQAQDAKAYSLQILVVAVGLLLLWDALSLGGRWRWATVLALALGALLVHRLSLLAIIGALLALQLPGLRAAIQTRWPLAARRLRLALPLLTAALSLLAGFGLWWGSRRAEGAAMPDAAGGPLQLAWPALEGLLLYRSSPQLWLLLPFLALFSWGMARLALDLRRTALRSEASFILGLGLAPLALYLLLMPIAQQQFDARYLSAAYPPLLLALAWPLRSAPGGYPARAAARLRRWVAVGLVLLALAASVTALLQPPSGLFSGAPVKEQYREAMTYLARKVHPDDAVVLHPHYLTPLYRYYAERVTPDNLPEPSVMPKLGAKGYDWGEFDVDLARILRGHERAWLLEAPLHGIRLDPPPGPDDEAEHRGHLTVNFYFAQQNRKWSCGPQPWREFLGLRILCQSFPEVYGSREIPQPAVPLRARFGEAIELRGYTLKFFSDSGRRAQAGGTLPVTLYWQSTRKMRPDENYVVFLHLVRRAGERPVAQEDVPPQEGALPTSSWTGTPVHDEHAVPLPRDIEPGRYKLLLGLYDPMIPGEEGRLQVTQSQAPHGATFVELATVEVVRP